MRTAARHPSPPGARERGCGTLTPIRPRARPVGVVYYRAGYSPDDYRSELEWEGRALLECSDAISCPNAGYHLAGCKKVQQDLAAPGRLERFAAEEDAPALRGSFAGLWSLEGEDNPARAMAMADPDAFVLKPQREGGGNNLYGEDLRRRLAEGGGLEAFILMERIRPRVHEGVRVMRNGDEREMAVISELGIFSCILARGDAEYLINRQCGHLLRTKMASSDEGGVAAGYAYLDSPRLV